LAALPLRGWPSVSAGSTSSPSRSSSGPPSSALCGAAAAFSQLVLIRVGVGVAEAGCSPPAHSLISDYFERSRRTSALSIYSCGTSLGYLLAAVGGAMWRSTGDGAPPARWWGCPE